MARGWEAIPAEVLGWVTGVRYLPEDLERAFFSTRHSRILDGLGYIRFDHWRGYGEEGLARYLGCGLRRGLVGP